MLPSGPTASESGQLNLLSCTTIWAVPFANSRFTAFSSREVK